MAIKIRLKHSATANKAPLPGDLDAGELALNINAASPAAYIKDSTGAIVKLAGAGAVGATDATTSAKGVVQLADAAAITAGTAGRVVDAAQLKAVSDADDWTRTGTTLAPKTAGDVVNFSAGTAALPGLTPVGDPNTGIYSPGADQVAISTGGTVKLTIDGSGNINTREGALTLGATGGEGGHLSLADTTNTGSVYNFDVNTDTEARLFTISNNVNLTIGQIGGTGGNVQFWTGAAERARIDSSGRLLVGTSSARLSDGGTIAPAIQHEGSDPSFMATRATADTAPPHIVLGKSRGSAYQVVSNEDSIGLISFQAADGTNLIRGAEIRAVVDGTPGANDMPGRLVFSTTADGAASPTERMRIDSAGRLLVGTSATETFFDGTLNVAGRIHQKTNGSMYIWHTGTTGTRNLVEFGTESPYILVGTISTTGSSTLYNTTSDYRLKENVAPVDDSITRLQQLKPSRFNFIADPDTVVDGFIAHEAAEVVPECVTGTKDAVDDDGNPVYQGIDQSKLVPLLTAALQEAITKIETLEAKVAALEAA